MGIIIRRPHLTSFLWILKVLIGNSWETLHPTLIKRKKSPKPDWSWRPSNWPSETRCHWIACLSILHHWDVYWEKSRKRIPYCRWKPIISFISWWFLRVSPTFRSGMVIFGSKIWHGWTWLRRFWGPRCPWYSPWADRCEVAWGRLVGPTKNLRSSGSIHISLVGQVAMAWDPLFILQQMNIGMEKWAFVPSGYLTELWKITILNS